MSEHDPDFGAPVGEASPAGAAAPVDRSLTDDLVALLDDGRTYAEAELQFQKTRIAFALDRGRKGALYGLVAFALLHLALVALAVGTVLALTPAIGAWAATGIVVAVLAAAGIGLALAAKKRFLRLTAAYRETGS